MSPQLSRAAAREQALHVLYRADLFRERDPVVVCAWHDPKAGADPSFFQELVAGVLDKWNELGDRVEHFAHNWSLHRMATIDRTLLRIGVWELFYTEDTPAEVVLNEAVELAKKYGDDESYAFVNGILDRVLRKREDDRG